MPPYNLDNSRIAILTNPEQRYWDDIVKQISLQFVDSPLSLSGRFHRKVGELGTRLQDTHRRVSRRKFQVAHSSGLG